MIAAHDFPYVYPKLARELFTWPWLWNVKDHDGLGVNTISTLWGWIQELLYGLLSHLGISWSMIAFLIGVVLVLVLCWYGLGKLLQDYQLSRPAVFSGRLFFLLNTYLLLLVDGGQLNLAASYGLIPWVVHSLNKLPDRTFSYVISVLAISFLDFRVVYLVAILSFLHMVFNPRYFKWYLRCSTVTIVVLLGAHAYWLFPSLMSRAPQLPATYSRSGQVTDLSFANTSHALTMSQPHWWKNIFGQKSEPQWFFWLIPLVVFSPLVLYKKNKAISFWITIACLGVFLVKGANPPAPNLYPWLFTHVPGWSLFRDPTKFFFIVALSFSVLWSFASGFIRSRSIFLYNALSIYLLIIIFPLYTGQMTGLFSKPRYASDYQDLAQYLQSSAPGNIVWVPKKPPLGYSDPNHSSINASTLVDKRTFASGIVGTYDTLNFLRDATHSGQLLSIASVGYIGVAPPDPMRDSTKAEDLAYRSLFTDQLASRPYVVSRTNFGPVTLLKTKDPQKTFFIPQMTSFVVGSDSIYQTTDLESHALVMVEEHPELLKKLSDFSSAGLLLHEKSATDAAAALVPAHAIVFPADSLDFAPNHTGFWKRESEDFVSWRGFLEQKYQISNQDFDFGGGVAVSEGENKLHLPIPSCQGECILLIRALVSPRGGALFIGDDRISTYTTSKKLVRRILGYGAISDQLLTYDAGFFSWFEISLNKPSSQITLQTQGDLNAINALSVITAQSWAEYKSEISTLQKNHQPTKHTIRPTLSYVKINPTHYSVTIRDAPEPVTLAFAQNFDPFWQVGNQSAIPLYGLINGFSVPGSGTYEIIYSPQKYVLPGLITSVITIVCLIFFKIKK